MTDPPRFSFGKRLSSFLHAVRGLGFLLKSQHNAWIHLLATVSVVSAGLVFRLPGNEWCLIILAMTAVWATEAMNTAVECLTDLMSPQIHPLAGKAKDVAAGAVLLASIGAVLVGLIVFGPHVLKMFAE